MVEYYGTVYHLEKVLPRINTQVLRRPDNSKALIVTVDGYDKPCTFKIPEGTKASLIDFVYHAVFQITGSEELLQMYGYTCIINDLIMDLSYLCNIKEMEYSKYIM